MAMTSFAVAATRRAPLRGCLAAARSAVGGGSSATFSSGVPISPHRARPRVAPSTRRFAVAADGASGPSDGLAFEPKSKSKRKRRDGKNTRRAKITVEGAAIEAAKGTATPTIQSATEEAYILFLFGYVVVIFLGGLVLAGSAFKILSKKADRMREYGFRTQVKL